MPQPVSFAKTTLSYPIYAADFDPYGRGYLVVGGGGGESKTGTLLDVSNPAEISTSAELELSTDEDSVSCIANLASKDGLIALTGINSGSKDVEAGKNEHFRAFQIDYPRRAERGSPKKGKSKSPGARKEVEGRISLVSKTSVFKPAESPKKETYQRIIRLSPAKRASGGGSKRLGAIATGFAKESEVIVFNATTVAPTERDIVTRISPRRNAEAEDLDLVEQKDGEFRLAFATEYDVYAQDIEYDFNQRRPRKQLKEPEKVYSVPPPDTFEGPGRPKFRALRFLTRNHVLLLANLPSKKGAELLILKLYPNGTGEVVLRKRLARHVKATTGMDVCALDPDPVTGARQIVVAVAGQDSSVSIFTLDYHGTKSDSLSTFRAFSVTKDVHPFQITKIVLSPFHAPGSPPSSTSSPNSSPKKNRKEQEQQSKKLGRQHIHLATTSMGNTVVVDTLPLQPIPTSDKSTRYILSSARSSAIQTGASALVVGVVMLVCLLLFQSYLAITYPDSAIGQLRFDQYIPQPLRDAVGNLAPPGSRRFAVVHDVEDMITHPLDSRRRIKDLLHHLSSRSAAASSEPAAAVVVRPSEPDADSEHPDSASLETEVHPNEESVLRKDGDAKRWDQLSHREKEWWRRRLIAAGAWAVEEGETVLQGIFFSSFAGAIGDIVAEALR
ncbi:hypothetical protein NA57DRAFT_47290 [Rhizodiscina lignyota]|uniref:Guanine nucleotide-exchange factor SEC12 n=1 Tax=Rhizodiscina lignyota TaxID=1504668 RepID=A0A9P4I6N3_9PEZI|nr:hypothetical protein NA57DRAFT_47290 [Rhizodiscina lignyota]